MKKSVWQDLKQDWKQNNDGASLVTVLVLVALLVIIVGVILTMTLMNYFMKEQNAQAQQNFYDAESALEEVRQGLILDLSDAAGMAYTKTLEQYENLSQTEKQK
jgi:type II secretory pathway component PulK